MLLDVLKDFYGFSAVSEPQLFSEGMVNKHHLVETTDSKIVIKTHRKHKTEKEVKNEFAAIDFLSLHKFPVPDVYKTLKKEFYVENSETFFSVSEFVFGDHPIQNEFNLTLIGEWLAKLHCLPLDLDVEVPSPESKIITLQKFIESKSNTSTRISQLVFKELKDKDGFDFSECPKGIVYWDISFNNIICSPTRGFVFLDFDDVGVGNLIFDIAKVLCYDCTGVNQGNFFFKRNLIEAFLKGYYKHRRLTRTEVLKMYNACRFRMLDYFRWHFSAQHTKRSFEYWNRFLSVKENFEFTVKPILEKIL